MRESSICPKCKHHEVLHVAMVPDTGEHSSEIRHLNVATTFQGKGLFSDWKGRAGKLSAVVCRECGYTEFYTSGPQSIPVDGEYVRLVNANDQERPLEEKRISLRPELRFPLLDEAKVKRLAELASKIEEAEAGRAETELTEFNSLASTSFVSSDVQGMVGETQHSTWVRNVLSEPFAVRPLQLTHQEMLEIITRLVEGVQEEHHQFFWLRILEHHLDPMISDLIFLARRVL